jgi:peptide deformylase
MNVSDCLTHIDNSEDVPYLRSKLLDVNMRLFKSNPSYKAIVIEACNLLKRHALTKMDGYKLPHGVSGANLGIPWNIIALVRQRGTPDAWAFAMLNPQITSASNETESAYSNCGSIRLNHPIRVTRNTSISVAWLDEQGAPHEGFFGPASGSFTIQHEIDHNNGILITDREIK